jgi:hypothetical protein
VMLVVNCPAPWENRFLTKSHVGSVVAGVHHIAPLDPCGPSISRQSSKTRRAR